MCGCGQKSMTAITSAQLEELVRNGFPGDQIPSVPIKVGSTDEGAVWAQ